jgi:sugar phosphate isomerase/epimerase
MKLSITMISYNDYASTGKMSVADFIELCAGYGLDAVDILEYYWTDKNREVGEIPGMLKNKGLGIGAFCVGNNFIVPAADRTKMIEYVKDGITTAARLGAERLRIFGGSAEIPAEIKAEDRIDIVVESIGKCIDHARNNNVRLVLENHGGIPATSGEMLKILNAVNSPFLKVNFDIGNFLDIMGEDPMNAAKVLYPYVDFIHAKDLAETCDPEKKYTPCVTGEGVVPVSACLQYFHKCGYDGYVSLEYEAWAALESKQGVVRSLDFLKKCISNFV